jgi:hypothetical protein
MSCEGFGHSVCYRHADCSNRDIESCGARPGAQKIHRDLRTMRGYVRRAGLVSESPAGLFDL